MRAGKSHFINGLLLQQGDVAGWDSAGRTVLQLSIDDWLLEELCAFDSDAAELEDTDGELEPDQEIDGPPVTVSGGVKARKFGEEGMRGGDEGPFSGALVGFDGRGVFRTAALAG